MEAVVTLTQEEACEAMRAYLVLRGALPAHGTVKTVKAETTHYGAPKITVDTSIEMSPAPPSAPVPSPVESRAMAGGA